MLQKKMMYIEVLSSLNSISLRSVTIHLVSLFCNIVYSIPTSKGLVTVAQYTVLLSLMKDQHVLQMGLKNKMRSWTVCGANIQKYQQGNQATGNVAQKRLSLGRQHSVVCIIWLIQAWSGESEEAWGASQHLREDVIVYCVHDWHASHMLVVHLT